MNTIARLFGPRFALPAASPLRRPAPLAGGTPQDTFTGSTLAPGSAGDDVRAVQGMLRQLGYFSYPTDTGEYGRQTANAVMAFQRDHGLEPSGKVGLPTWTALKQAVSTAPEPSDVFSQGSQGEPVRQLQAALRQLGYFTYPSDTGDFGAITEQAVKDFQRDHGLVVSGQVGGPTWDAIRAALAAPPPGLAKGATGEAVRQLQSDLRRLGYFTFPSDTGNFAELTEAGVKAFQRDNGLAVTGVVDAGTQAAISAAVASLPVPSGVDSRVRIDPSVQPKANSSLQGYEDIVEQCGEFAYRYFKSQGKDYPTIGQPYTFLTTGVGSYFSGGRLVEGKRPEFQRNLNGGAEPPRAGDILVAKGPKPGQFHTAIITEVRGDEVHVLQANVPYNWQGGKEIQGVFKLEQRGGGFYMPDLPTSRKGYNDDYAVAGWIHPTGANALPPG